MTGGAGVELRQLKIVVAVAEEGGFSAAGRRLRLVQSAVSATIRAVERELDVPVKAVGVGEKEGDLVPFDPNAFVEAMIAEAPTKKPESD
jgi:hypothetical protein